MYACMNCSTESSTSTMRLFGNEKNIWVNYFLSFEKHNILLSVHFWSYFAAAILMSPIGVGMAMGEDSHINMPGKLVVIAGKDPEN